MMAVKMQCLPEPESSVLDFSVEKHVKRLRKALAHHKSQLPLKKRLFSLEVKDASKDDKTSKEPSEPVDFSLPTRIRANKERQPGGDSKHSSMQHSDTDSEKCSETGSSSQISPPGRDAAQQEAPLDLTVGKATNDRTQQQLLAETALVQELLVQAQIRQAVATFPFLANYSSSPLLSSVAGFLQTSSLARTPLDQQPPSVSPPEQDLPCSSGLPYVINPATGNRVRRNYKNTTRARRQEANARERNRVHTIGASFDALRTLVPSVAPEQKLSKLSVLRIACRYIMLLAAMNGLDYSSEQCGYSVADCTEMLHETIYAETKLKRHGDK